MMKCPICGSKLLHDQKATVKRAVNGKVVYFQNVPAEICENKLCGQIILIGSTVSYMQQAVDKMNDEKYDPGQTFNYENIYDFMNSVVV